MLNSSGDIIELFFPMNMTLSIRITHTGTKNVALKEASRAKLLVLHGGSKRNSKARSPVMQCAIVGYALMYEKWPPGIRNDQITGKKR